MTLDTTRPAEGGGHGGSDVDILAGLWEEVPFARLPWDAPNELRHLLEDIENPKRVHAIHKASRRHNFQLLVQKYIVQLREGCGADYCHTPTCFTCRKRLAGRAPIRRYNPTSARTLAIYLASQDNAENGLCPSLKLPKGPPAAMSSLIFTPNPKQPVRIHMGPNGAGSALSPKTVGRPTSNGVPKAESRDRAGGSLGDEETKADQETMGFTITERHESKDYRSFAANVFGTVAFKMLEWLTPSGIEDMSRTVRSFQTEVTDAARATTPRATKPASRSRSPSPTAARANGSKTPPAQQNGAASADGDARPPEREQAPRETREKADAEDQPQRRSSNTSSRPAAARRNSNAKVRTSGPKPKRQLSIDPFPTEVPLDDSYSGLLKSPRLPSQTDKNSKGLKTTNSSLARPISQLSSAGFFDDVSLEKMPPPKSVDIKTRPSRQQANGSRCSGSNSPKEQATSSGTPSDNHPSPALIEHESDSEDENILPQTLSKLDADMVDFLCDVLQEDKTNERHMLEPPTVSKFHNKVGGQARSLKRKSRSKQLYSASMKLEWKLFVEQTLFYVLSEPQPLVRSFVKKGQLYDSQTLWYCMLRMTRVAPTLVFQSLWMAAASLFAPPSFLQSLRSPTARLFPKHEKSLSNTEAGILMSICLHALVAAAPLVSDARDLYDMSRIRSHGLSLAESGAVARQPSELCLQYDDAFNNDLALRLARRLFAAITTRRYFDDLNDSNLDGDHAREPDVLSVLFSQLDFLNMDAAYILNFSFPDRALHETRVPTLLLDWARAVMLNDWDGNPVVPGDGPFGGALALIEAMYKKRQALLLGDAQFRSEYFAERLDAVQMPVAWLAHTSTRQKMHLLDFPYIFSQPTLVSYFRSINFSRMSRAFEESSSLQGRMSAIVAPKSLIVNQHHKDVLQDLLKTASSRYLILEINRDSVITDAFDQLWRREERELMRPLKVHLGENDGEEGFDSGGVQQEFFRLAISEALDPGYGGFTVDERTRMTWFQPGSSEPEWKFELIGLLVSLALYNGLTLPITFPKALYRKLLGEPVTELHHIADGWPDLASGLTKLLEWDEKDGLVEDIFARTYEFSVSMFGKAITREMQPAPDAPISAKSSAHESWPQFRQTQADMQNLGNRSAQDIDEAPLVTNANRNAYVSDYIRYLTEVSVRPQYEAFARGFRTCLHPKSLTLLTAPLLQSLVEGVQEIDVAELKRYTRYVGWDASHRTVRDFWSIVRKYDDHMKRKLLEFVTASDRVPVGGIKNLQFVVQKNGEEEGIGGHLPTAYTCYGTLLLPEYRDKEVLRERLAMALENAQGFGFA